MLYCYNTHIYHGKSMAHTGRPHPNISTIFIGRSNPDEDLCRDIPRSAHPITLQTSNQYNDDNIIINDDTQ
jgi:hypothetical protein